MSRCLTVSEPGVLTTLQDAGRPGHAHLGVPRSGWLDGPAALLAHRLVGNSGDQALLECLLGGLDLVAGAAMTLAVTGADCPVSVDGRPVGWGEPVSVRAGARVRVGRARSGVRCYLAVAGGIVVDPVLGSRSTDTLSGLGPAPLSAGAVLPVGPASGPPAPVDVVLRRSPGEVVLRCRPGPRADWFTSAAHEVLLSASYAVTQRSDRVGLRLDGPLLQRSRSAELPSEGMVLGAVQVPPDGRPLVFLADHPTTGGYPVVAVVDPRDLHHCAQLGPGDRLRFAR